MNDDETWTAYHEAGHAVIAHALGGTVDWMQMGGEADDWLPDRFGDCRVNWGLIDPTADWQRQREVLTVLAGPVAEMLYRGETLHRAPADPGQGDTGAGQDDWGPWLDDWRLAWLACESFLPDPKSRIRFLEGVLHQLAVQMRCPQCWAAIAAVADELLAHETLEAEQISEILGFWIDQAGPAEGDPWHHSDDGSPNTRRGN